jgi:hypothetical protein
MNYICPRCSAPVSPSATVCPSCRYPEAVVAPAAPPAGVTAPLAYAGDRPPPPAPPPPPGATAPYPSGSWSAPSAAAPPPPPPPQPSAPWDEPQSAGEWSAPPASGPGSWDAPLPPISAGHLPPASPLSPYPTPAPPKADNHGPLIFAALAVMATVAVVAWALASGVARRPQPAAAIEHPASWEPRVQFAVDFVESEKVLQFRHPVAVTFLPENEFEELVSGEADAEEGADDGATQAGMMRAIGMMSGAVDVGEQAEKLAVSGTLAFYNDETDQVYVRGTELTPMLKATLVHELTHAWQDQQYDLSLLESLTDSEARFAYRAVVEGDATMVERAWVDSQTPDDQSSAEADETAAFEEHKERTRSVASFLAVHSSAPYLLGPSFLEGIEADGGAGRIKQAFTSPPPSSAVLMRPWMFGSADGARSVEAPPLPDGRTAQAEDTFGALSLYLLLADRIDPRIALEASDNWLGDRVRVESVEGGGVCLNGRIEAAGPSGAQTILNAFELWDAEFAGSAVTVRRDGSAVLYEACDPGEGTALHVPNRAEQTILFPVVRMQIWQLFREEGATPADAECAADNVATNVTIGEAADMDAIAQPRVEELITAAATACMI